MRVRGDGVNIHVREHMGSRRLWRHVCQEILYFRLFQIASGTFSGIFQLQAIPAIVHHKQ